MISGDNQFIIVNSETRLYTHKLNTTSGLFELQDNHTNTTDIMSTGLAISDDHEIVAVGKNTGVIAFYSLGSGSLTFSYTLTDGNWIVKDIQITSDKQFLVVGSKEANSYVYTLNISTEQFELAQTIPHDVTENDFVDITEDHQYLVIIKTVSSELDIYKYSENTFVFDQSISLSASGLVYCRISGEGSYIICADKDKFIHVFENRNGIYKKVQEVDYSSTSGQARAEISKNYDYAFIRLSSKNYIYKFKADVCGFLGCRACRNPY